MEGLVAAHGTLWIFGSLVDSAARHTALQDPTVYSIQYVIILHVQLLNYLIRQIIAVQCNTNYYFIFYILNHVLF